MPVIAGAYRVCQATIVAEGTVPLGLARGSFEAIATNFREVEPDHDWKTFMTLCYILI